MQVGNLLHKWNVENDQACNKLPTSFHLVRQWIAAFTGIIDLNIFLHSF